MSRAVASSQPIANEPTRKRSPANDATISIPKPPMLHANAVPFDRSWPIAVPATQKPIAIATRNMTWPRSAAVEMPSASWARSADWV